MKKLSLTILFLTIFFNSFIFSQNQNVSINYTGAPADNSAILDVSATDKGILIPRMNTAQRQAITAPATGLLVYDTGYNQFWFYSGMEWKAIGGDTGGTISDFLWDDATNLLTITEDDTDWQVTINNEADDLTDNIINDLGNVDANPTNSGEILEWDGTKWVAGIDNVTSGGTAITNFTWDDPSNLLRISEGTTNWDVYIDNEADDLSDNVINDLSNVNTSPTNGDLLQWDGSQWIAANAGSSCVTLDEAYDCGGSGAGRIITADAGSVEITSSSELKPLLVSNSAANTFAISAEHTNSGVAIAAGNSSSSSQYSTIQATTSSTENTVSAILGSSSGTAYGVTGQIEASGNGSAGVHGNNLRTTGGHGVYGMGVNGIVGETNYLEGFGVYGINNGSSGSGDGPGVYGIGEVGVFGQTENGQFYGVLGENLSSGTTYNNIGTAGWGWVGVFGQTSTGVSGDGFGVFSDGDLGASGTKLFVIDHPNDPENKMLKHYCTESPEVLNIYRGNVFCDQNGEAVVKLPDYFNEINKDFSYYLTPIGDAANLYVKTEVNNNSFVIAGGKKGLKVSWILYAKRNDKYMQEKYNKNEEIVEIKKRQKGKYIHPELWGKTKKESLFYTRKHKKKQLKDGKNNSNKPKTQNILK